jgi:D-galactarolactone cycloisomerase
MNRRRFGLLAGGAAAIRPLPAAPAGTRRLKITRVNTVEVRGVPTGKGLVLPWASSAKPQDTRDYVITQFFTDQGLIGTTMDGDGSLRTGIGREVQQRAEAYFIGKDPFEIEVHQAEFFLKQKAPVRLFFLELGLWDIIGKAVGEPLYRLWGAATDRVKPYAATVHFLKTPRERAEDALKFYEQGFRAIKIRFHSLEPKDDLALAEAVMRAVGGKMAVMVDANMASTKKGDPPPAWDFERALYMARALDEMGLYWLEEPLNRFDFENLARIRKQMKKLHLAGGEGNIGLKDFRQMCAQGAYSYLQPDPVQSGTLSMVRKVTAMAEAFGILVGPHHGKSGLGMLANLHLQCAAPNSGFLEYMHDPGYWSAEGFQAGFVEPYPVEKTGYVRAPSKPGLGADWDRKFFQKHGLTFG